MRIFIWLFGAVAAFAQANDAIEKAVLAANDRVTRAAEARDLDGLFRFMADTDKGSIVQDGVLSLTPKEARARVEPGFRQRVKVVYRWKQQYVTVLSSSSALVVSDGETVVTSERGSVTVPFVQSAVWVLRDGERKQFLLPGVARDHHRIHRFALAPVRRDRIYPARASVGAEVRATGRIFARGRRCGA